MMFEWILVGMISAAAIVMVAHTIDEAVCRTQPLRARSHRCPDSAMREEELASRIYGGNADEVQKRAA
jgi:hypothetical protein